MIEPGTLYYNGFFFPDAIDASVAIANIPDTTNRYTAYLEYSISVTFVVFPGVDKKFEGRQTPGGSGSYVPLFPDGDSIDDGMQKLRRRLNQQGGHLQFTEKGLGTDLIISPNELSGQHHDISFGPVPTSTNVDPIAANKAAKVSWECVFRIPDCDNRSVAARIGDFNYSIVWAINEEGLTSRTISGLIVAKTFRVGKRLSSHADTLRDRIQFPVPLQFIRQSQNFTLSEDRRELRFSIVDQQSGSDSPLYPGTIRPQISMAISSPPGSKAIKSDEWRITISGNIRVAKGTPKWFAWVAFLHVVKSRMDEAKKHARVNREKKDRTSPNDRGNSKQDVMLITSFNATEEIFDRGMSFSVSYMLFCSIGTIFQASGMWQKVPGSTWETYRASMSSVGGAWGPRGNAGLKHSKEADVLMSFCDDTQPPVLTDDPNSQNQNVIHTLFGTNCPSREQSWIMYSSRVELIEDSNRYVHYPIGGSDNLSPGELLPDSVGTNIGNYSSSSTKTPRYFTRGNAYYRVRFSGIAVRIGFEIPRPALLQYGGRTARQIGKMHVQNGVWKSVDNCKVYLAKWTGEYILDGPPEGKLIDQKPDPRLFNK